MQWTFFSFGFSILFLIKETRPDLFSIVEGHQFVLKLFMKLIMKTNLN
jgi:hypothetical protein